MKILSVLFALIVVFASGIFIAEYKTFPYQEIRYVAVAAKNIFISSQEGLQYRADRADNTYPHLRINHNVGTDGVPTIVLRSNQSELPKLINLFSPLTGEKEDSIGIENFSILSLPTEQCVLANGETCSLYVELTFKEDNLFQGTYLVSTSNTVNESALEPNVDIIRFNEMPECPIAVVYPDYTFLAYNNYGGHSLYTDPFPVAGIMSSSMVSYDRPLVTSDITKTYLPTHTIARAIEAMDVGCVNLETNSSLDNEFRIDKYNLVVLTGHDEYWTDSLRKNIDSFVDNGGSLAVFSGNTNFRRLLVDGNIVSRDIHTAEINPTENSIGLACRFGCSPVSDITALDSLAIRNSSFTMSQHLRGMKVIASEHPIFEGTGLSQNDFFGVDSSLIWYEIDGAPLNPLTDLLSIETLPTVRPTYDGVTSLTQRFQANNVTPLASSYLTYFGSNPQYAATIVEYRKGDGVVLNGGSVGWYRVLNTDVTSKIIFQNIIKFLLEADERVAR